MRTAGPWRCPLPCSAGNQRAACGRRCGPTRQRSWGELACEALAGNSSPLYNRLYEKKGLINSSFTWAIWTIRLCLFLVAGGETKDPEGVRDAILQEGKADRRGGGWKRPFPTAEKGCLWRPVRGLNSFETLCVEQAQGYFAEQNPWTFPEIYDALTRQDVEEFLRVLDQTRANVPDCYLA